MSMASAIHVVMYGIFNATRCCVILNKMTRIMAVPMVSPNPLATPDIKFSQNRRFGLETKSMYSNRCARLKSSHSFESFS